MAHEQVSLPTPTYVPTTTHDGQESTSPYPPGGRTVKQPPMATPTRSATPSSPLTAASVPHIIPADLRVGDIVRDDRPPGHSEGVGAVQNIQREPAPQTMTVRFSNGQLRSFFPNTTGFPFTKLRAGPGSAPAASYPRYTDLSPELKAPASASAHTGGIAAAAPRSRDPTPMATTPAGGSTPSAVARSDDSAIIARKRDEANELVEAIDDIGVPRHLVHELRDLTHKYDTKNTELSTYLKDRQDRYRGRSALENAKRKELARIAQEQIRRIGGGSNGGSGHGPIPNRVSQRLLLETDLRKIVENKDRVFAILRQAVISKGIPNAEAVAAGLVEAEEAIAQLRLEIAELERKADSEAELQREPDRPLRYLADDIMASAHWMTDPRPNMVARDQLQRLQVAQQSIADGKPGFTSSHEYAHVDAYFMYSKSRGCAIMIEKKPGLPVRWEFKHYYERSQIERVREIFKSCDGRAVDALSLQICPITNDMFADG